MYRWILLILLLPSVALGQFVTPGGGASDSIGIDTTGGGNDAYIYPAYIQEGSNISLHLVGTDTLQIAGAAGAGTADSMGVDTDGDGVIDNYLYATGGAAFVLKKGTNITLGVDTDTLTISGPAGAGTADSLGIDTDGDGAIDNYLYSTAGPIAMIQAVLNGGATFSVDTDTLKISTALGMAVTSDEISNSTITKYDIDSTNSPIVFDDAFEGTSEEADSQYSTHNFVRVEIEDSLDEYSLTSAIEALIADSLDEYSLTTAIEALIADSLDEYSLTTAIEALIADSLDEYSLTTAIVAGYVAKIDSGTWDEISDKIMLNQASLGNASDSSEADSAIATLGYVQTIAGDSAQAYDDFSELSGSVADGQIANDAVDGGTGGEIQDQTIMEDDLDSTNTDYVVGGIYKITSEQADSAYVTKHYADGVGSSGTADSMGVDTDGNGTVDAYLYSTTAGAFHLKKGSNITLTVDTDTVTIAATGGGVWTVNGDSLLYVDGDGDTTMAIIDDDAGNVRMTVGRADQTLSIQADSINVDGSVWISNFDGTGLQVLGGTMNISYGLGMKSTADNVAIDTASTIAFAQAFKYGRDVADSEFVTKHYADNLSGSGSNDSTYINDGTEYGPFTNDMFKIKEGTGINIVRDDSTNYDVFNFNTNIGAELNDTADVVRAEIRDTVKIVPKTFQATIMDPDNLNEDSVLIVDVRSEVFPSGITITDIGIVTRPSSSYSVTFQEWTEPDASGTESTIETVATSSSKEAEDAGGVDDPDIAAGSFIVALLPATDIDQLEIWIVYTVD